MAAFRFNISISVVAAPTGHRRTPAPKPDRKGKGCDTGEEDGPTHSEHE